MEGEKIWKVGAKNSVAKAAPRERVEDEERRSGRGYRQQERDGRSGRICLS